MPPLVRLWALFRPGLTSGYVRGPVYVVGPDVFDLDSDNDGVACES